MKQVSVLFDALRNEKFAIAVKDGSFVRYHGSDGQGKEWASWANSVDTKSLESTHLPAGVVQGPFKNATEQSIKSLILELGGGPIEAGSNIVDSVSYVYKSSVKTLNAARVPAVMDSPIGHFTKSQYLNAVDYKALTFKTQIKHGSFLFEAKVNDYAFDFEKNMYNCKPSVAEIKSLRQRIDTNLGRSSERRLGLHFKQYVIERSGRYRVGASEQMETKSIDSDVNVKAIGSMGGIGQRIGGGTRAARRMARGAFASFDPKAWDGDGDGLVQEGTPFERPAIPGVNDRSTGGRVDASAATEAWRRSSSARNRMPENRTRQRTQQQSPQRAKPSAPQGMRSRVAVARNERQASGLASRSDRSKLKSKLKATPGVDRVDENDGSIWRSLGQMEGSQEKVKENAKTARLALESFFKSLDDGSWWDSFLRQSNTKNSTKTDADGNPWNQDSRIDGEALTSLTLEMNAFIKDEQNALAAMDDGDKKKASRQRSLERIMKAYDDLITLGNMTQNDDYSLIEHLHPERKQRVLGVPGKLPKNEVNLYKPVVDSDAGKKLASNLSKQPSTIFEEIGGKKRAKSLIGERADRRLAELADKITRPNPKRAERRRLRREGKGKTFADESARDKISRTKRRIAKAKRDIQRKIKGKRNPEEISSAIEKVRKRNTPLFRTDSGGNPIVDSGTISGFAKLLRGYKPSERRTKDGKTKGVNADSFLGQIWDSQNFSALPTTISEEEARELISQGWIPIQRGHGGAENGNIARARSWAEDYIYDPRRFVTGEGGAAVGPGEYWAHPKNTAWDSWITSNSGGLGTLALIPPSARVLKANQASQIKSDGDKIADAVDGYFRGAGSGGLAESLDPSDLVAGIREHLRTVLPPDSSIWNTEIGKIYAQLLQYMETASPSESAEIRDAIKFLTAQRNSHYNFYAMILGYDGVDHGSGSDGRVIWFNRGALSIIGEPIEYDKIKEFGRV